jgi:hypothetical protein
MHRLLFAFVVAPAGIAFPAAAEVLHLKCEGSFYPWYVTVDLGRKVAKTSLQPADDRQWWNADVSDTSVSWDEFHPKSPKYQRESVTLNRYSGDLEVVNSGTGGTDRKYLHCARAPAPTRQF